MGNEAAKGGGGSTAVDVHHQKDEEKMKAIQRMDASLRRKLKGGVSYNMKLVIRGERGSGKTALLHRLQGLAFTEKYSPTPEIQTATINWTFKEGEEVVKVEVWDVVDKGIRYKGTTSTSLRLPTDGKNGNNGGGEEQEEEEEDDAPAGIPLGIPLPSESRGSNTFGVLDATMVDVYKQCQCAIFLVSPYSWNALEYVRRELPQVPPSITILLLLNFRDLLDEYSHMDTSRSTGEETAGKEGGGAASGSRSKGEGHHPIQVTLLDLQAVADEAVQQGEASNGNQKKRTIHLFESSVKNCYGLTTLYKYLNIPFLSLKQEVLCKLLEQAGQELSDAKTEILGAIQADSWEAYTENLKKRAAKPSPGIASSSVADLGREGVSFPLPVVVTPTTSSQHQAVNDSAVHQLRHHHHQQQQQNVAGGVEERSPSKKHRHRSSREEHAQKEGGGGKGGRSRSSAVAITGEKEEKRERRSSRRKERSSSHGGSSSSTTAAAVAGGGGGVMGGKSQGESGLADVDEFTYKPRELVGGRSELDDFFADEDEEGQEVEVRRQEEYARIAACLKPGVATSTSSERERKGRGSRDKLTRQQRLAAGMYVGNDETDESDEEERPFVYVGLRPVDLSLSPATPADVSSLSSSLPMIVPPPPSIAPSLTVARTSSMSSNASGGSGSVMRTTSIDIPCPPKERATRTSSPQEQQPPPPPPPPLSSNSFIENEVNLESEKREKMEQVAASSPPQVFNGHLPPTEQQEGISDVKKEEQETGREDNASIVVVGGTSITSLEEKETHHEEEDEVDFAAVEPSLGQEALPDDFFDDDSADEGTSGDIIRGVDPAMQSQALDGDDAEEEEGPTIEPKSALKVQEEVVAPLVLSEAAKAAIAATMKSMGEELGGSMMEGGAEGDDSSRRRRRSSKDGHSSSSHYHHRRSSKGSSSRSKKHYEGGSVVETAL